MSASVPWNPITLYNLLAIMGLCSYNVPWWTQKADRFYVHRRVHHGDRVPNVAVVDT